MASASASDARNLVQNLFEEGAQGATDAVGLEVWRAEQANATPLDEGA